MQTNSKTHPFRVLWIPRRGGYHSNMKFASFASETEARAAAICRPGFRVELQQCKAGRYIPLDDQTNE